MLVSMHFGRWASTGFWLPVKFALLAAPWIALWTALAGATPEKTLLRLWVRPVNPGRIGLAAAMRREGTCLFSGVALGTPAGRLHRGEGGIALRARMCVRCGTAVPVRASRYCRQATAGRSH